jgi:O-antigen ligase
VPTGLTPALAVQLDGAEPRGEDPFELLRRELDDVMRVRRRTSRTGYARCGDDQDAVVPQHARGLPEEPCGIFEVLDHLEDADEIEACVAEGKRMHVGLDVLDVGTREIGTCELQCFGASVDADDGPGGLREMCAAVTNPAARVEDVPSLREAKGEVVALQVEGDDPGRRLTWDDAFDVRHRRQVSPNSLAAAVAGTVAGVVCVSSWSTSLQSVGSPVRVLGLLGLAAGAVLAAAPVARRHLASVDLALLALVALCFASAAWSVEPRQTLVRGGSFGLVLLAARCLGIVAGEDPRWIPPVLAAVVATAALAAAAGAILYVFSPEDAVQAARIGSPTRLRGIGVSPDTLPMLYAVALPAAVFLVREARSRLMRLVLVVAMLLLLGSVALSGSRGGIAAAGVGLVAIGVATPATWSARATGGLAGLLAAGALAGVAAVPQPSHSGTTHGAFGNLEPYTPNDAEYQIRLQDEVGYGHVSTKRSLLNGSGRTDAWRGAIEQADDRPALGYGFGTEADVFVDRYAAFQGGVPENSFIGFVLGTGLVGLAALIALLGLVAHAARRLLEHDRRRGAVAIGTLSAGIVLAVVQSYIYSFGNVATVPFWTICFVLTAHGSAGGRLADAAE